jgi:hypothetical protein
VSGAITKPDNEAHVAREFDISVTLQNAPSDRTPFLVTEVTGPNGHPFWNEFKCSLNRVWPARLVPPEGSNWNTWIAVGAPTSEHAGLVFKVTLLLVDGDSRLQFEDYIQKAERGQDYSGVGADALTGAIEEVDSISVTRL